MRITITIDDDVAGGLERLRMKHNKTFQQTANEALRQGLARLMAPKKEPSSRHRTASVSLGRCLVGSLDDVSEVLAVAEGERARAS